MREKAAGGGSLAPAPGERHALRVAEARGGTVRFSGAPAAADAPSACVDCGRGAAQQPQLGSTQARGGTANRGKGGPGAWPGATPPPLTEAESVPGRGALWRRAAWACAGLEGGGGRRGKGGRRAVGSSGLRRRPSVIRGGGAGWARGDGQGRQEGKDAVKLPHRAGSRRMARGGARHCEQQAGAGPEAREHAGALMREMASPNAQCYALVALWAAVPIGPRLSHTLPRF